MTILGLEIFVIDEMRIKKLIHRANYRGFKEVDLILGGFAKKYAEALNADEFAQFESLLAEKDHDIYDWITGSQPTPPEFDTPLFATLKNFNPSPVYGGGAEAKRRRRGERQTQNPAGEAPPSERKSAHLPRERGEEK